MQHDIFIGAVDNTTQPGAHQEAHLLGRMANRHGLIAGATGTGKTVTLQTLAEGFSRMGTPVFLADIKGDLAGLSQVGEDKPRIRERVQKIGLPDFQLAAAPVVFWDVYGELGHPLRTTISDMGPLLLARLLNLNDTQAGVLNIAFRVADEQGLLLLDIKDLRALMQHVAEHARELTITYGNVSAASVGAIQRALLTLEDAGGTFLFGEPAITLDDLLQTDAQGRGVINVLAAEKLFHSPQLYATLLLWLLAELFEQLPEAGDLEQPKLVFFFDEAHLLFDDAPKVLIDTVEKVVRLIRSKGVGIYFITQNPLDVPLAILGQLGNRVQHALRAFTPRDQEAVRVAADTFRPKPGLNTAEAITQLGVGEALVSCLDSKGTPNPVERVLVAPPRSRIGAITPDERTQIIHNSNVYGVFEKAVDRESAYEILKQRTEDALDAAQADTPTSTARTRQQTPTRAPDEAKSGGLLDGLFGGNQNSSGRRTRESVGEAFVKSTMRAVGSRLGQEIIRGVMGAIIGKGRR
ncbi:MAG: ATP-binding protein [Gammaproteobacteria bacterium 28-57-27]|nr:MAG: ATP-binding protein [Gammaproteobacteria bacterium 28-57-27]